MRAMVLDEPGRLRLREVADPRPRDGEVLVRVSHSGICGTDSKIYSGAMAGNYPLIMGHEVAGTVVGGDVDGPVAVGTRVLVDPVLSCGRCDFCRRGATHLCVDGALMGREAPGGFAELMAVPVAHCHPLPATIDDTEAPLIQVLTTVQHSQAVAPVAAGETVVVLGLGVTGELQVQLARANGAGRIVAVSRNPAKRAVALAVGADIAVAHGDEAAAAVAEATQGSGADMVIETVGHVGALAEAMTLARAGGRVVAFGIYTEGAGELPFSQLYFKELSIIGARAALSGDFPASIAAVEAGRIKLTPLVSHVLPFTELPRALAMLAEGGGNRLKIIFSHDPD